MFGKCIGKQLPDYRLLIGIIDLIAAYPLADPGLGNTLRVTDRAAFVLEGQIASRVVPVLKC